MGYRFRCVWCGKPPRGLEFNADRAVCPKCGRAGAPHVQELVFIHFLMPHPHGPFLGPDGLRRAIACEPKRDYLAMSRLPEHHYSATPDPREVTCPSCQGVPAWGQMMALFPQQQRALEELAALEKSCCG